MEFTCHSLRRLSPSSRSSAISISGNRYRKRGIQYLGVAPSVYGGAGGQGTHTSVSRRLVNYGNDIVRENLLVGNEKMTMQNLNDRLASYIEKVRSLEQANLKLEEQIKQWYETNVPSIRDYSAYYKQIEDLRNQIKEAEQEKGRLLLRIDNCQWTGNHYRLKCEAEKGLYLAMKAAFYDMCKTFDDLNIYKINLEFHIEELNHELILLKKEHQEEVDSLSKQLGNTVNVELKAAPGLNLSAIMNEMRQKYDALAAENLQKAKEEFQLQTEDLKQQVTVNTEELNESQVKLKELNRTYQKVELELESQLHLKDSLENTLKTTKANYHSQLATIQAAGNALEAKLMQVRTDAERQNQEYNHLLDIKTRLEQEIATYRHLLEEGADITTIELQLKTVREIKKTRLIKTVIEETVNGKDVSSQVRGGRKDVNSC